MGQTGAIPGVFIVRVSSWPFQTSAHAAGIRSMSYEFDFADVFAAWPELLLGLVNSLVLSGLAMAIGMVVAVAGALGTTSGPRPVRWAIKGYIELIRNTPFLVQIFLIYFIFRLIILKPAIQAIYPSLTSQFILLMLNSSVCSAIAATELTAVAGDIQSRTFRSFEVYFVVTCLYFGMSLFFWTLFATIERTYLRKPTR
jgi:polar amino acid transport system permease protein